MALPLALQRSCDIRIAIVGNGLLAHATLSDSGSLVVEALDIDTEAQLIAKVFETPESWQLDDKLSRWLSEVQHMIQLAGTGDFKAVGK